MKFSAPWILLAAQGHVLGALAKTHSASSYPGLTDNDCQIRCPQSTDPAKVILPSIVSVQNATGDWENTLECWEVDSISTSLPGIDNAYRLDWEEGFDAGYQYIFYGESFMQAHSTPEPSLIVVGGGIGDLRMPSGRCLRVQGGDNFFSFGTKGKMTAWWAPGTVVSDFYFKDGVTPEHIVVPELEESKFGRLLKNQHERLDL